MKLGGGIPYARGMQAGDWIYAQGVMATDYAHGLDVVASALPLSGQPRGYVEAAAMYARAYEVLQAGGADFSCVARTDQYYPDWRTVPFLHRARREYCGNYVAPSTSILELACSCPTPAW